MESLESTEMLKDKAEQERLTALALALSQREVQGLSWFDEDSDMQDVTNQGHGTRVGLDKDKDNLDDDQFMQYLENLKNQVNNGHANEDPELEDELDAEENSSVHATSRCWSFCLALS